MKLVVVYYTANSVPSSSLSRRKIKFQTPQILQFQTGKLSKRKKKFFYSFFGHCLIKFLLNVLPLFICKWNSWNMENSWNNLWTKWDVEIFQGESHYINPKPITQKLWFLFKAQYSQIGSVGLCQVQKPVFRSYLDFNGHTQALRIGCAGTAVSHTLSSLRLLWCTCVHSCCQSHVNLLIWLKHKCFPRLNDFLKTSAL